MGKTAHDCCFLQSEFDVSNMKETSCCAHSHNAVMYDELLLHTPAKSRKVIFFYELFRLQLTLLLVILYMRTKYLVKSEIMYIPVCVRICLLSNEGRSKALPHTWHGRRFFCLVAGVSLQGEQKEGTGVVWDVTDLSERAEAHPSLIVDVTVGDPPLSTVRSNGVSVNIR